VGEIDLADLETRDFGTTNQLGKRKIRNLNL